MNSNDEARARSRPPTVAGGNGAPPSLAPGDWNQDALKELVVELSAIALDLAHVEDEFAEDLDAMKPSERQSARNLLHYMALRRRDIRHIQQVLAALGLSSLGRTESHVAAAVESVLKVLHHLNQHELPQGAMRERPLDFNEGRALLGAHTEALLGPQPQDREVRIMVTVPSEAADDYELVNQLVASGMDCMRINCAHDGVDAWSKMVANLRRAREELGCDCQVLMDVAGPKLRTGPIDPASQIVRWKPLRDARGNVTQPARIWITDSDNREAPPSAAAGSMRIPRSAMRKLRASDRLRFVDLRGRSRTVSLEGPEGGGHWGQLERTAYLQPFTEIRLNVLRGAARSSGRIVHALVGAPPPARCFITVKPQDTLVLTREPIPGASAELDGEGNLLHPTHISCTLPEVFGDVRPNERIWFDDGKIGGLVQTVTNDEIHVLIQVARPGGSRLREDKGINLPDSNIRLPGLTEKDIADIAFITKEADLIGLSFIRRTEDILALHRELARLGADRLGIVLKIETRAAFEQLPSLLLTAMQRSPVGVMIARGDLAVECGFERLAEVQEEMLWVCEAAHIPVIWATQVLETLAQTGQPSRAEITDAAMGERAECVMLNKGPHLVESVRVLDNILRRMQAHQGKKSARLRALRLSTMMEA